MKRLLYLAQRGSTWFQSKRAHGLGLLHVVVLLLAPSAAAARLNLPQRHETSTLSEKAAQVVRAHFLASPAVQPGLPPTVAQSLLDSAPRDFRHACGEVIASWGTEAGAARWDVRQLFRETKRVWLAFRCGSVRPDLSQYYDERLAVLHLDAQKLEFFAFAPDAENDSSLFHTEFSEILPLQGAQGVAFRVASSNDNPCCGGPEAIREERLMVFAISPQMVTQALSVVTEREHHSHNDVDGDTQSIYRAEVQFEPLSGAGGVSAVVTFREEVNGKPHHSGSLRYRWNPAALKFDEVR